MTMHKSGLGLLVGYMVCCPVIDGKHIMLGILCITINKNDQHGRTTDLFSFALG